ncbi:MAG: succinate dehydrogenase/fumarate reductase iron-sulfur subunit [Methanomicrobiales archaeon]|jgi:fumarate reductase (CoM/CoB) subunit B|nr:succinate dehydrogenase/fumarate reductase iron-sulfur subunit [Methanomicrobiales archaeon]
MSKMAITPHVLLHVKQPIYVRVRRYNPDNEQTYIEQFTVHVYPGARVINVLQAIKDQDSTFMFRMSCEAGQCGSCAVHVNGSPVLACVWPASDGDLIEPLNLPVIRDLMVDLVDGIAKIPKIQSSASICQQECQDVCHEKTLSPLHLVPSFAETKEIKELAACLNCLCCVSACPAVKVVDFAGPTAMRGYMRIALDPREARDRIQDAVADGLFSCTTCQSCWTVCPKHIKTPGKAIEKLRAIASDHDLTLPRHREILHLIERTGRSVDSSEKLFLDLVDEVIEPYGEVKGEVVFFVGCMFNARLPDTALDMVEVMRHNGIRLIIPKEQVCCGSPLIRTGQRSPLLSLMQQNMQALSKPGIATVMTMCAGCGSTLKHDYEDLDLPFVVKDVCEVMTEFDIKPDKKLNISATYHDPCHLFGGQEISKEPRVLLSAAVERFIDMPAQCCGSGGGVKAGQPDEANALGELRREMIRETGADIVVTVCPFCEYHLADHSDKPVKNLLTIYRTLLES